MKRILFLIPLLIVSLAAADNRPNILFIIAEDASPTKSCLTGLSMASSDYPYYELSFGKRPAEELYDMAVDPDCVCNLAGRPTHAQMKARLWKRLEAGLRAQGDPRVLGQGDIFDFYPNCRVDRQRKLYQKPDIDPVVEFEKRFGGK